MNKILEEDIKITKKLKYKKNCNFSFVISYNKSFIYLVQGFL